MTDKQAWDIIREQCAKKCGWTLAGAHIRESDLCLGIYDEYQELLKIPFEDYDSQSNS